MGQPISTFECCNEGRNGTEIAIDQIGCLTQDGEWVEVQPCHARLVNCMSPESQEQDVGVKAYSASTLGQAQSSYMDENGIGSYECNGHALESLSYLPVRFDEADTYDVERSRERYSKVLVHGTRARTERGAKWDSWLRSAALGRSVTLVELEEARNGSVIRVPSTCMIDKGLTRLTVLPTVEAMGQRSAIQISIRKLQSVCAATDYMMMWDQMSSTLTEAERPCAIVLQYTEEGPNSTPRPLSPGRKQDSTPRSGRPSPRGQGDGTNDVPVQRRICFLEQSAVAKDQFVEAVTALWLEKRNDHSMWF